MMNDTIELISKKRLTAQNLVDALQIRFLDYYGFEDELCQILQNRLEIKRIYADDHPDHETAQMLMIENESLVRRCMKTVEYANQIGGTKQ